MGNFNTLVYRHDSIRGLIPSRYKAYPLNMTGLLHAADNVLIYSADPSERSFAQKCRDIAINNMNYAYALSDPITKKDIDNAIETIRKV